MGERDPLNVEVEFLREFYTAWVTLHKIPRDKIHRGQQERAAQELVDAAHQLKFFYKAHEYIDPTRPRLVLVEPANG